MGRLSNFAAVCVLLAFIAVVAAFTLLYLDGSPEGAGALFAALFSLLGVTGLGAHLEARVSGQNRVLDHHSTALDHNSATLDQINAQTNGVLDRRIEDGSRRAMTAVLGEHPGQVTVGPPVVPLVATVPARPQPEAQPGPQPGPQPGAGQPAPVEPSASQERAS